jgi:hypothetical protein
VARSIVSGVENGTASETRLRATRYSAAYRTLEAELAEAKILKCRRSIIRWYSSVMRKEGTDFAQSRKPREAVGAYCSLPPA